jgi:flagellin-like protein
MFKRGLSMRHNRRLGRRGISPLIATVLLIAFAVAVGTLIMGWIGKETTTVGDCSETKLEIQMINEKPLFCYDMLNNKINVMVKNTGNTDINRLKMRIITPDFNTEDKDLTDSAIKAGDIKTKNIQYIHSGKFRVEIIPVITSGGKEKTCSDKYIFTDDIISCN